jgi:N-hydroxyarylamine O-acetyltransferase
VGSGLSFDLDAYLARIGLSGRPGLAEIHRAHAISIPFENLDPHRGLAVSLAIDDLVRKLVDERRGGYCFEQNLLLAEALTALGLEVDLLLARVRAGSPPGTVRPRSHLVLRVRDDRGTWHADVGFGRGTLLEPIPFGPGGPQEQSGWCFRVVAEPDALVLQTSKAGGWLDLYAFSTEPVPRVDVEVGNWFTSTHPASAFVTGLIATAHRDDGSRVSLTDWGGALELTEETAHGATVTPVERTRIPELLSTVFGLDGWRVDAEGRVARRVGSP